MRDRVSISLTLALLGACCPPKPASQASGPVTTAAPAMQDLATPGEGHLKNVHQLTFGGENAEAYWSFGGDQLIFQTTRDGAACDKIMKMPATGGPATQLSSGEGRTTCSYFFPGDDDILYASTHEAGPACPPPPDRSQGYVWALYDYDIYKARNDGTDVTKLFGVPGKYDAEATICGRDGTIIFTSDKDGDLDLYKMKADGTDVVRLTNTPGYDGGAFFSSDCSQIVWRAQHPTGAALVDYKELLARHLVRPTQLEIWIADADGGNPRQLTYLESASFAPFFKTSSKRVLFSSNYGDPKGREFDIWAIDTDGTNLERITYSAGFDGFPMFSPDGERIAFSSNRGAPPPTEGQHGNSDTNVFVAEWIPRPAGELTPLPADDARRAIDYLAADEREGRGVGTAGLLDAQQFVEDELRKAGVVGGLAGGAFRQPFSVTTKLERGPGTKLTIDGAAVDAAAYVPSGYSASAKAKGDLVEVGYGIVEPKLGLDDYKGKAVKGKVVIARRFAPDDGKLDAATRSELGDFNYKARLARAHGARGLVIVDVPAAGKTESALPNLSPHQGADAGLPIVVVTRAVGEPLLTGKHTIDLAVALTPINAETANLVGVIRAQGVKTDGAPLVIGAHLDHLGMGGPDTGSLEATMGIHNGADDNASGVAALLEVGRRLVKHQGQLTRDVYLVAFSGEEMGLLGSTWFVAHPPYTGAARAMLNMDMVGRLRGDELAVLGAESSDQWPALIQPVCEAAALRCNATGSGYGPSDHMAFYIGGSPVLHFFTGPHPDYHKMSDDAPLIHAGGIAQVARVVAEIALAADVAPTLSYHKATAPDGGGDVPIRGASLGTIPEYSDDGKIPGMALSAVVGGGPADKAGLKRGDRIVQIGDTEIRNVQDLMLVLGDAVPGKEVTITYLRDGQRETTKAVYAAPRSRH